MTEAEVEAVLQLWRRRRQVKLPEALDQNWASPAGAVVKRQALYALWQMARWRYWQRVKRGLVSLPEPEAAEAQAEALSWLTQAQDARRFYQTIDERAAGGR